MRLTDKNVAALKMPPGKNDHFEIDDALPGFGVRLRGTGNNVSKNYRAQWRMNGKTQSESIGDVRQMKVETAREAARIIFGKVAKGEDRSAERTEAKKQAVQQATTLGRMVPIYIADRKRNIRASSMVPLKRYLEKHFAPLHGMPLADIKRKDVAATVMELEQKHGKISAARARSSLSALFAWCIERGLAENNPVSGSFIPDKGWKPNKRELEHDEIRTVWHALGDDAFAAIMKLLFYTGCRRSEIGDMQWHEINLETGVLTLPPERTKNKEELILSLPPSAMAILKAIPRPKNQRSDFVFTATGEYGFRSWSFYTRTLNERIEAAGYKMKPWTIHDIRRTVRTNLSSIGVIREHAEAVIGHKPPSIVDTYDKHTFTAEIKSALLRWADHLEGIIEDRASNVIPMQAAE